MDQCEDSCNHIAGARESSLFVSVCLLGRRECGREYRSAKALLRIRHELSDSSGANRRCLEPFRIGCTSQDPLFEFQWTYGAIKVDSTALAVLAGFQANVASRCAKETLKCEDIRNQGYYCYLLALVQPAQACLSPAIQWKKMQEVRKVQIKVVHQEPLISEQR